MARRNGNTKPKGAMRRARPRRRYRRWKALWDGFLLRTWEAKWRINAEMFAESRYPRAGLATVGGRAWLP